MGKTLYLECNAGISGDMTVAALLDLGADEEGLRQVLDSIPVQGFETVIRRVKKAGVVCCDFAVIPEQENRDHDMEYLHGEAVGMVGGPQQPCGHHHEEGAAADCRQCSRGAEHHQEHPSHGQQAHEHRGLPEIIGILEQTEMTEHARELALRIFDILAAAEAKAHAVPKEQVHFHEVGAVDSIVDIVAAAVCIDNLGIDEVIVPILCEGVGTVRCQHGVLPVPVPAVANIITSYHLPLRIMQHISGEFITPTGAAIVAALETKTELPERFCIVKTGMGAGKREYERPSILRAMLIQEEKPHPAICQGAVTGQKPGGNCCLSGQDVREQEDTIWKLESNIDDCTGENLGFLMELLLEAGARDVYYTPVYMKKNRPAWQLSVLCEREAVPVLEQMIFRETTTIGIRHQELERSVARRKVVSVATPYGAVRVKLCHVGGEKRYYPEYDSVVKICREQKLPYGRVWEETARAAARLLPE